MVTGSRSVTVVVVAHNDARTLADTVERIHSALSVTVEEFRIVVFDDGSTDDTREIAEQVCQRHPFVRVERHEKRLGAGYCTVKASGDAETTFLAYVPADNTWPPRSYIELFGNIGKADIITSYSVNLFPAMPFMRRMVSRAYSFILNLLFGRDIRYYNGLTIYPVDYLRQGPIETFGLGFQAEALIKAVAAGYSFLELALAVDAANLPHARTITTSNTGNAISTILRLFIHLYILRRAHLYHPRAAHVIGGAQRADELGIGESVSPSESVHDARSRSRIVIVGASSGIGERLTHVFAEQGHELFICARRTEPLQKMAHSFPGMRSYFCDVSDEKSVVAFVDQLRHDTEAIDILINCAGTFGEIGPIALADSSNWWHTLEVNLRGPFLMIKHLLPLLEKGEMPRIINFAGGGAFSPFPNYSAYACSKAAIVRMTECLADELYPKGIRVNAIAPGFLATEMHKVTIEAGEERAGRMQFQRTQAILDQGPGPMENVVRCIKALISPAMDPLTGKTISSNFDPWESRTFLDQIAEITRSDLYTLRRMDVVNLPEGWLRTTLSRP